MLLFQSYFAPVQNPDVPSSPTATTDLALVFRILAWAEEVLLPPTRHSSTYGPRSQW